MIRAEIACAWWFRCAWWWLHVCLVVVTRVPGGGSQGWEVDVLFIAPMCDAPTMATPGTPNGFEPYKECADAARQRH